MGRLTISFTDEQEEWIEHAGDELDRSKAKIVRAGIDALRGEDSPTLTDLVNNGEDFTAIRDGEITVAVNDGEPHTTVHRSGEVAELKERLAAIEEQIGDEPGDEEPRHSAPASSDREPQGSTGENPVPTPATDENTDESPLSGLEFPNGRDRAECVAAVRAAREFLDENNGASKREVVEHVMPDHPAGYDVGEALDKLNDPGERYRGSWWRKIVNPGLSAYPDVEKPRGGGEWSIDDEATDVYDPTAEFE